MFFKNSNKHIVMNKENLFSESYSKLDLRQGFASFAGVLWARHA